MFIRMGATTSLAPNLIEAHIALVLWKTRIKMKSNKLPKYGQMTSWEFEIINIMYWASLPICRLYITNQRFSRFEWQNIQ